MNNVLDMQKQAQQQDYAQQLPLPKFPIMTPSKPSMGAKLSKVAEIFELDIIDEVEALKACQVIIRQHTRKVDHPGDGEEKDKIVK